MNNLNKTAIRYDRMAVLCVKYFFLVAHDFAIRINVFNRNHAHLF